MSQKGSDRLYSWDEVKLNQVRQGKAWMNDPKYFKKVKISPSALIKMMTHGQSGVEKGVKKGGKPIEVMGLLLGRPDTEDQHSMIITDSQPLPIEGFETRVIADDEGVINYMIELGESNEILRKEKFCGWYHTHPFDVDEYSQCFLSNTDISTQLQWQRAEDPHGNPWVAIVIDPLRSIARGKPELGAFRVYPPEYSPPPHETPNGAIVLDDHVRVTRWGAVWNRYYQLEAQYFMSSLAQETLNQLKNKFLWQSTLSSSSHLEEDHQTSLAERIDGICHELQKYGDRGEAGATMSPILKKEDIIGVSKSSSDLANEGCRCCISDRVKRLIFTLNK